MEPSLPVTFTEARVPSVTVTSTGAVKSAFVVPSAGVTLTTAFLVTARTDAVADDPCEASAEPLPHPVSRVTAGTAPSAARIPRRDHFSDCPDRFNMCESPTAGLSGISALADASCAPHLG